jgi:general secretion pathway protein F
VSSFRYTAVDAQGARQQGTLEAEHARAARAQLRERGWLPEVVEELQSRERRGLSRRVTSADLALFSRQFATLLAAGLSIERALAALGEQAEVGALSEALKETHRDVMAGQPLAVALERQGKAFPRFYPAIVRAAEESGALPQVMERLAGYLERGQALRHKVMLALIYPLVVSVVALLVIGLLLTYVVPQVVTVFEHAHGQLPLLTRIMIALSDGLRATWWLLLATLVAAIAAARAALKQPAVRLAWHGWLLKLPLIGRLRVGIATARFANTLSVLVGSGVPVVTALSQSAAALDDAQFAAAAAQAAERVRQGMAISRALREAGHFPPMLLHLTASGEAGGELARVLEQAARQQELMVETRLSALTSLLEPLLILVMGGVVLLIVLATLQPIIEMNQLLK